MEGRSPVRARREGSGGPGSNAGLNMKFHCFPSRRQHCDGPGVHARGHL